MGRPHTTKELTNGKEAVTNGKRWIYQGNNKIKNKRKDEPQPLIIGGRPPILNQMQSIKMIRKIDRICALLKGLEYLLRFSPKGIINKTPGK